LEKYKFRLQKLLDIRLDKEEQSKREFREAQLEKEKVEHKLNELKVNFCKYKGFIKGETLIEQKIKHMYLNALNASIMETTIELQNKVQVLELKRQDLKQKQVDRKTVEILKDKQLQAFFKEQDLIEQKNNDEFALYGYIRNRERR
jgi:flagellar FliJ protein